MLHSYTPEFKQKIVRLHLEERRTYKSIPANPLFGLRWLL